MHKIKLKNSRIEILSFFEENIKGQ